MWTIELDLLVELTGMLKTPTNRLRNVGRESKDQMLDFKLLSGIGHGLWFHACRRSRCRLGAK